MNAQLKEAKWPEVVTSHFLFRRTIKLCEDHIEFNKSFGAGHCIFNIPKHFSKSAVQALILYLEGKGYNVTLDIMYPTSTLTIEWIPEVGGW